jgi:8-oxo-dGTP diphosphatase
MTKDILQAIAVKAVIKNNNGKLLILREAKSYDEGTNGGLWQVPGGRIVPGEYFDSALLREVKEETGLNVRIIHPLLVGEWHPVIKGIQHQIVGIFFYCKLIKGKVMLSKEHDSYEWISAEDIMNYKIIEPDNTALKKMANTL